MLGPDDMREALDGLGRVLAAVEAGELDATAEQLAFLRGAVASLGAMLRD